MLLLICLVVFSNFVAFFHWTRSWLKWLREVSLRRGSSLSTIQTLGSLFLSSLIILRWNSTSNFLCVGFIMTQLWELKHSQWFSYPRLRQGGYLEWKAHWPFCWSSTQAQMKIRWWSILQQGLHPENKKGSEKSDRFKNYYNKFNMRKCLRQKLFFPKPRAKGRNNFQH